MAGRMLSTRLGRHVLGFVSLYSGLVLAGLQPAVPLIHVTPYCPACLPACPKAMRSVRVWKSASLICTWPPAQQ